MPFRMAENASSYDWPTWFMGIFKSLMSGFSVAVVSGLSSIVIAPGTFNLSAGIAPTFKLMGVMMLFQGLYRMAEFLQLHAGPDQPAANLQKAQVATQEAVVQSNKAADAIADAKSGVTEAR